MSDIRLRSSIKNPILNIRKATVHSMHIRQSFILTPMFGLILFSLLSVIRLESATDPGRTGATLYKEYCSVCHGNEGREMDSLLNILTPGPGISHQVSSRFALQLVCPLMTTLPGQLLRVSPVP